MPSPPVLYKKYRRPKSTFCYTSSPLRVSSFFPPLSGKNTDDPPSSLFEHAAWVEKPGQEEESHTHRHTESAQFKDSHADQGVPHPDADERGGVPHRSALHDPGE